MALRNAKGLDRFVYISCSPKSAVKNWVDLARPCSKSYRGNPFRATAAVGVDMFPQTHHSEMVLLFERIKDEVEVPSVVVVAAAAASLPDIKEVAKHVRINDDDVDEPSPKIPRIEETQINDVTSNEGDKEAAKEIVA